MQACNIADQRQSEPGAGVITNVFQTVERHERLLDLRIIDSRPAVFNIQQHRLPLTMQADRDDTALRRIADRVIQQICAQLAQQHAIASDSHR